METNFKMLPFPHLLHYFDDTFESCKLGLSKPDPNIYKLVCSKMNVKPSEVCDFTCHYFKKVMIMAFGGAAILEPNWGFNLKCCHLL